MNKDDILRKSRKENQNGDERENQLRKGSALPAIIAMGVTGLILMILEVAFLDTTLLTNGLYLLFNVVVSVQQWYLFGILKKKNFIFTGICFSLCSVLGILRLIDTFTSMM